MNSLKQYILIISIGILVLIAELVLLYFIPTNNNWFFIAILLLSVITIACFSYFYWVVTRSHRVLLLGDQYSDSETLINRCDSCLEGEHLKTQILPTALLEHDSPRARSQLKTLKGSLFCPPRLVIAINMSQFFEANTGEKLILTTSLNRILETLKHKHRRQKIDLVFTHMQKLTGYIEFSRLVNGPVQYTTSSPMIEQLGQSVDTKQALIECTPPSFMLFLSFMHELPSISKTIDSLIADLLLTAQEPKSSVYFFSL